MALITWTKEQFGTNVSQHDQEHQSIFQLLNALDESIGGGDKATIGANLDQLIEVVVKHFQAEEANFSKYGYPDAAAHKEEHDKLVQACSDLQKKFHAGDTALSANETTFVKDWLTKHIPNIDKRYGPFLNEKGVH